MDDARLRFVRRSARRLRLSRQRPNGAARSFRDGKSRSEDRRLLDLTAPLIYLADQRLYPLSFGLYAFQVQVSNPGTAKGMGMVMAGSLLMTLPVIATFFFAQRYFRGVTLTGMKG